MINPLINGIKDDDRPDNLEEVTRSWHTKHHNNRLEVKK
jgi:hypothetical protein